MEKEYIDSLLSFYDKYRRILPWREDPTPYHVYISEIMLQQTRVDTVKEYYLRFVSKYPDVDSVANADIDNLQLLWQGLGYYSRIKNIKKACEKMKELFSSSVPDRLSDLLKLPGIGDYTSKAILAISYQEKYVAVDGNLLRVFSRLTMFKENIKDKKTKEKAEAYFMDNIPSRPGDYLQALMDLGEMVCLPNGKPLCEKCPFATFCLAHKNKREIDFPVVIKKTKVKEEDKTIVLFLYQNDVLINKRKDNGLLASLYEFTTIDQQLSIEEMESYCKKNGYSYKKIEKLDDQRFVFTHRIWNMTGYLVILEERAEGSFVPVDNLYRYTIPTVFSYYSNLLKNRESRILI